MKTKCYFMTVYFLMLSLFSFTQEIAEKQFFDKNKDLGGDVIIKKSSVKIDGDITYRIFQIESPEEGNYYFNAWLMAAKSNNGSFIDYDIEINGTKVNGKFKPEKSNWQNIELKDTELRAKEVKLHNGINTIAFIAKAPEIPEVEFIRLSTEKVKADISDKNYKEYIEQIKDEIKEREKNPKPKKDSLTLMLKSGVVLPNPEGNYYQHIGLNFRYTTYKIYAFNSGQQVFFSTYASDNYEHVLEVFNSSNAENYSWVTKSNSSGLASLNINIPSSGIYYVRVRAYRQETQGLVNLNVNGQYYFANCAVSGSGFRHAHNTQFTTYNYFTCKLTGDSRIWIEDDSGTPGKIRAHNDDYYGSGDFYWGLASRVKKRFLFLEIGAALISSYSSYNPIGTCDLYMKCQNSNVAGSWNNLKPDDAIQSANTNNDKYNCASWGGGRVDLGKYFWASHPPTSNNLSNNWYVEPYKYPYFYSGEVAFWLSWDNFFGNNPPRFGGAPSYTKTDANSSNAEVAMFGTSPYYDDYQHIAATKPANDQPHGYDWESKPGGNMRTFHPRDAIGGSLYGTIQTYYKRTSSLKSTYSLEQSVALGLTVLPYINLSQEESNRNENLKKGLSAIDKSDFDERFSALIAKSQTPELIIHSNPYFLYQTQEFISLLKFCNEKGETLWPILFEEVFDSKDDVSNELAAIIVNEITPSYGYLMEQVKDKWTKNCYTPEGAYIAPSPMNNTKNYIKKLLSVVDDNSNKTKGATASSLDELKMVDNYEVFSVYPNPFKYQTNVKFSITDESSVSLKVFDMQGRLIDVIYNTQKLNKGQHSIEWIPGNLPSGLYLFTLSVNNKTYNRRFLIED